MVLRYSCAAPSDRVRSVPVRRPPYTLSAIVPSRGLILPCPLSPLSSMIHPQS